jgi:hypothetical protein
LSCRRFEFDTISEARDFGKKTENPKYKRNFYGYGCTKVSYIEIQKDYSLYFTPIYSDDPKNIFHCDIYDNNPISTKAGVANARITFKKELFKKIWRPNKDSENISKEDIQPPTIEEIR